MNELIELNRKTRKLKPSIDEELRGWNWDEPPLLNPYQGVALPISDIYNELCGCGAYVYLKHVSRRKLDYRKYSLNGFIAHTLWTHFYAALQKIISNVDRPEGLFEELAIRSQQEKANLLGLLAKFNQEDAEGLVSFWINNLWMRMSYLAVAEYIKLTSSTVGLPEEAIVSWMTPLAVELKVDGTRLGFGQDCRVDALSPTGFVIELKTSKPKEIHKYALTAYALAIEAHFEIPINHGLLIYLYKINQQLLSRHAIVQIENGLRLDTISYRDKMIKIVAEEVLRNTSPCSQSCPYNMMEVVT